MLSNVCRVARATGAAAVRAGRCCFSTAAAGVGEKTGHDAGDLWLWGKIDNNRMGMRLDSFKFGAKDVALGPTIPPTPHPSLPPLKQVVCKGAKTVALGLDGSVYTWGTCENTSLGHGADVKSASRPRIVEALAGIPIVSIAAGETSTAAISDEGELFTWGWGGSYWEGNGGLGHGDSTTQPRPALVESLLDQKQVVTSVAVGNGHMLALTSTGLVYAWGNTEYGRCGNGRNSQMLPEAVELLAGKRCVAVAAGAQFSLALTSTGELYGWGKNDAGQLGLGGTMVMDLNTMESYPVLVDVDSEQSKRFSGTIVAIAASGTHSLALSEDGTVWQWGQRAFLSPSIVDTCYKRESDAGKEVGLPLKGAAIAAGEGVSAVVDEAGHLYTWGKNLSTGMLGFRAYGMGARQPTHVAALRDVPLASISFGSKHAGAVVGTSAVRPKLGAA